MFKEGLFINPHDQRHYDEEQRVEELHRIAESNIEYLVDELNYYTKEMLEDGIEEYFSVDISGKTTEEKKYIKELMKKEVLEDYKLVLVRR